jgi:hypothetical protein
MGDVTKALYTKLSATSAVTTLLGTYASSPAIFSGQLAPRNAVLPYIVIGNNLTYRIRDDGNGETKEIFRDIRCYIDSDKSYKALETLTDAVHDALHDGVYTVDNHTLVLSRIVNIIPGPIEDDVVGMILTVRLIIDKT